MDELKVACGAVAVLGKHRLSGPFNSPVVTAASGLPYGNCLIAKTIGAGISSAV